jgi:nucleotide-binding universal stress UspA family protein
MKTQAFLPLVTYPETNSDAIAAKAAAFAEQLSADLNALALNVDIPPVSSILSPLLLDVPEMIRNAETVSRDRGEHLLARVRDEAQKRNVPVTTKSISGGLSLLGDLAGEHARYFDISLVGWEAGNATARMTAEGVIFGSGRPAILLPELWDKFSTTDIAIAWDGSRVAARAAGDALPFLERAEMIHILTVVGEKPLDEQSGERFAAGLRKRGLATDLRAIKVEDCEIAVTLQEHAIEAGAGMLVMGGYGHSRIRDFVLGGATEGILNDLRLPALLSH